jgi:hypothetical protein
MPSFVAWAAATCAAVSGWLVVGVFESGQESEITVPVDPARLHAARDLTEQVQAGRTQPWQPRHTAVGGVDVAEVRRDSR